MWGTQVVLERRGLRCREEGMVPGSVGEGVTILWPVMQLCRFAEPRRDRGKITGRLTP